MDEWLKQALEIVKAQANFRVMTEAEITSMVQRLAAQLKDMLGGAGGPKAENVATTGLDPKQAVKDKSITCLECGKVMKVITARHLGSHGLTPEEYRGKHGYEKKMPLIAKGLARERRKKMKEMKLWERRGNNKS